VYVHRPFYGKGSFMMHVDRINGRVYYILFHVEKILKVIDLLCDLMV
jgi:hypothetical protein